MLLEHFKSRYEKFTDEEGPDLIEKIISVHGKIYNQEGVATPEDITSLLDYHEVLTEWVSNVEDRPGERRVEEVNWALSELTLNLRKILRPCRAVSYIESEPKPTQTQNKILQALRNFYYPDLANKESSQLLEEIIGVHNKVENQKGVADTEDIINLIKSHQKLIRSVRQHPDFREPHFLTDVTRHLYFVNASRFSITSGHQIGRAKSSGSPVKSNPHGKGRNLVKLNSDENIPSTSTPAKKMFDTPASSYCASDRNGKRKATEPMETDNEESYENGGGEDKDEEEEPKEKPTRGRPRKAILKDAAKRLKKL
ncbi:hypothetical protein PtA15_17A50 [Puccinia triticina]|uniref:Uncharacterized protein n=1 Tax=Puccinia triticina TaxID=208348 RepID=A0ABY7D4N1_9BASI|nr:uncharacterized protein PtA15_17A50 [Puccinia triticina]WAQ92569.1 hypothetical protein PtA15_17A50 [Puccinia triticina]